MESPKHHWRTKSTEDPPWMYIPQNSDGATLNEAACRQVLENSFSQNPSKATIARRQRPSTARTMSKRLPKQNVVLKELSDEINFIYNEHGLSIDCSKIFCRAIEHLPRQRRCQQLAKEIMRVKEGKSVIQFVLEAVQAREKLLHWISNELNEQEHDMAQQSLMDLRQLTVEVVESVDNWRKFLQTFLRDRPLQNANFMYEGKNYLLKIRSDLQFLRQSRLAMIFEFSKTSDPFLMHPSYSYMRDVNVKISKLDIPVESRLLPRIKAAERTINEDNLSRMSFAATDLYTRAKSARSAVGLTKDEPPSFENAFNSDLPPTRTKDSSVASERKNNLVQMKDYYDPHADQQSIPSQSALADKKGKRKTNFNERLNIAVNRRSSLLQYAAKIPMMNTQSSQETQNSPEIRTPTSEEPEESPTFFSASEVELEPFVATEKEALKEIKVYLSQTMREIKYSMTTIDEIKETALDGFFYWLKHKNSNTTLGLLIYRIDTTVESPNRIYLTHWSSQLFSKFKYCLKAAMRHIWTRFPVDEIRTTIQYQATEHWEFYIPQQILEQYYARGFKGTKLINIGAEKRVMHLINYRQPGQVCSGLKRTQNMVYFQPSIQIRMAAIIALVAYGLNTDSSKEQMKGIFTVAAGFRALEPNVMQTNNERLTMFLNEIGQNFEFPGTKSCQDTKFDLVLEHLEGLEMGKLRTQAKSFLSSFTSIDVRWKEFVYVKYQLRERKYSFMKIITLITRLKNEWNQTVYLVPTANPDFTAIFAFPHMANKDVFVGLKPDGEINELLVPTFDVQSLTAIKSLSGQPISEYCIKKVDEGIAMSLLAQKEGHKEPPSGMLTREYENVIDDQFHFGMIYNPVDSVPFVIDSVSTMSRI